MERCKSTLVNASQQQELTKVEEEKRFEENERGWESTSQGDLSLNPVNGMSERRKGIAREKAGSGGEEVGGEKKERLLINV